MANTPETNDIADRIAEKILSRGLSAVTASLAGQEREQIAALIRTELEAASMLNQSALARIVEVATAGKKQTADPDARERFEWDR